MNDNLLIETKEIGDYRINIYYDESPDCPVSSWDMGASHIFASLDHYRMWLSRDCDWKEWCSNANCDMEDVLRRMASEVVAQKDIIKYFKDGNIRDLRFVYNRSTRLWELQTPYAHGKEWMVRKEFEPYELKNDDWRYELLEELEQDDLIQLIQDNAKDFVFYHWSSRGYSQGDYIEGISYMDKKRFDERCGFSPQYYKTWQEQAMAVIEGEVKCIEMWAWGDVKGFTLEKKQPFTKTYPDGRVWEDFEWEEIDSCWGYYLEADELIKEVIAEHDLKEVA